MTYVPIVPITETPASPRTQELAGRLSSTIREFEQSHPETRPEEIQHALRLAAAGRGSTVGPALVAVGLGLLLAGGLAVLLLARRGEFDPTSAGFPIILVALMALAAIGAVVGLKR